MPQVLGWIYFVPLADSISLIAVRQMAALFFVALVSISSFGYLLNDFFDVEADSKAGKKNSLANFSLPVRIIFVALPFIAGIGAWALMPFRPGATILLAMQIAALIVYSAPPFRLKNRGLAGVLTDAFYGHVNPVFITLTAFITGYSNRGLTLLPLFALIFIAVALKGIRNILLHQTEDRKKDRRAGTQTFVVKKGALFTLNLVNRLLPAEIGFTILLALFISYFFPPFFLSILLFTIVTYLKFSGWKLNYLPKRQLKFKFLYFLNDYYEGWVPVFFLILLTVQNKWFGILLLAHLLLLPAFLTKLVKDLKTIRQNFQTEDDY